MVYLLQVSSLFPCEHRYHQNYRCDFHTVLVVLKALNSIQYFDQNICNAISTANL